MYVIEFPFNKIVRLYFTAYYRLKNPLQILFWGCRLFKGNLKILENVQEKLPYGVPFRKLQVFKLQPPALPCMFLKFWKIPENVCCGVPFYKSRSWQVLYQGSFHTGKIFILSRRRLSFIREKVIVKWLQLPLRVWGRVLRASPSGHIFPLWGSFPPTKFFSSPWKS